jgi:DNA adenine methylase
MYQPTLPAVEPHLTPFLKWPGGKRFILKEILPLLPLKFGTYYEPFLGGGALFFRLRPETSVLSDKNPELINCFRQVQKRPDDLISEMRKLRNSESDFYRIRASSPKSSPARAARFLYLVTLAFNGIYRLNMKGEFNVPYGHKTHLDPCHETKILAASEALEGTKLFTRYFSHGLSKVRKRDLFYFDPPYTVAHGNNGFLKYNDKIFLWRDQIRLAKLATELSNQGCYVFVSNADHPSILELYDGFSVKRIERSSVIAADPSFRSRITECVFYRSPK